MTAAPGVPTVSAARPQTEETMKKLRPTCKQEVVHLAVEEVSIPRADPYQLPRTAELFLCPKCRTILGVQPKESS